ncbi:MAG: tRNA (N(6)-L-threonylcarbamoyladenosine(37)-C(2))-methylthiotransferase MtaB [Robiginitomaculum sp.]|nr:MAG: tRNA (N(6)-L-threonylcarbamoyladenosine(37)-C(2))-methylthiotransferase MtaB [Robiginitomaculum sp.]
MSTLAKSDADEAKIITLGCRLNTFESEVMGRHARDAGLEGAVIINTCAVTGEAVRRARQTIRRARRENPDAKVIVTGCAAQVDADMFAAMDEVDHVLGNAEKMNGSHWNFTADTPRVQVGDIQGEHKIHTHNIERFGSRARTYIEVQNGCDHRCTFCIIPFGRGPARSVPADEVVAQVQKIAANGVAEVVLSGVDMTSWGKDLPGAPPLGALVGAILRGVPELARLRLSSIDAIMMDDELFALMQGEERLTPYLHLSLQAGDNMILKRMKRRHSREDAIDLCARLKAARPEIAFGADLIAGFPTETEAMFENTLKLVEECDLSYLHVFPFSPRTGTPAARMPAVPPAVAKDRAARLRDVGAAALVRHLDRHVGQCKDVLVEKPGFGRLADFSQVSLDPNNPVRIGAIVPVRLLSHDGYKLNGQVE